MASSETWVFDDPPDIAVLTTREVMLGEEPILFVSHDADDGGWQFLGTSESKVEDGVLLSLEEIVDSDQTIKQLADLPLGWIASRQSPKHAWVRSKRL